MENNIKKDYETQQLIDRILKNYPQLEAFDRYNKLRNIKLRSRRNYLQNLIVFVKKVRKDFKNVTREDIEDFIGSLDNYSEHTRIDMKVRIKKFFQWFYKMEEGYPDLVKWIKVSNARNGTKLPKDMLSREEVLNLANATDNLRDKAIILVLYESASRISELCNIKIKDILFDSYGSIISVSGKTGDRKIRLIDTSPILRDLLNNHPNKNEPESYIFFNKKRSALDEGLTDYAVRSMIKRLAKRIGLKKKIHPHLFRHSRLTELAKKGYNETFLKHFAGWAEGSSMCKIYIHASAKDLDDAMLQKEGLLKTEEIKSEILRPIECFVCGEKNSPTNRFCSKCANILSEDAKKEVEAKREFMQLIFEPDVWKFLQSKMKKS